MGTAFKQPPLRYVGSTCHTPPVNNSVILRISYVYVTYILRIWYVIDSGKDKVYPKQHFNTITL